MRVAGAPSPAAASAHQDHGAEHSRMVQPQQQRDARAHADAADDGFPHAFGPAHREHVVRHVPQRERRLRLVGAAVAPDVQRDHPKVRREVRHLVHEKVVVERVGVHPDERQPLSGDLVVDAHPIGIGIRHGTPRETEPTDGV